MAGRFILVVLITFGAGVWGYMQYASSHESSVLGLTSEAKAYARSLRLSDVQMKATENYFKQTVVEIDGNIANAGTRTLETVEIFCIFQDRYGQLVLRRRVPIVGARTGGLKPGETKSFRLPFDDLPESWNQAMPQLVIASVKFS